MYSINVDRTKTIFQRRRQRPKGSLLLRVALFKAIETGIILLMDMNITYNKRSKMKTESSHFPLQSSTLFIFGCLSYVKGQLISKANQSSRGFSQKTNENTSHSSKNEFIRSFFGRILGLTVCFRN